MSKLNELFQNKKAFIPLVVADDPDFDTTVQNVVTLSENGADIVELGIPFSDPVADGPIVQAADLRAFDAGVSVEMVFKIVEKIRESTDIPLVFQTYTNIPFKYGYERFCQKCQKLNVSGLVIPDLPLEEQGKLRLYAEKYSIDLISIIAPTSADRISKLAKASTGFVYVMSSLGMKGVSDEVAISNLEEITQQIKKSTTIPIVIALETYPSKNIQKIMDISDGIIINSDVVQLISERDDRQKKLIDYVVEIQDTMHSNV